MKINRIFAVLMAVIFIGSQPMAVLAEDVPNEIENVSNETEELLNETEDIANETENVSDEAETVSDETAESEGLRDQSGFVENSFRYSNGQPIQKRSAGASVIHRMPIKKSMAFAIIHRENRLREQSERSST